MEIDGTGVPMRPKTLVGRVGKVADGRATIRQVKMFQTWEHVDDTPHYEAGTEPATSTSEKPSFAERYRCHRAHTDLDQAHGRAMIIDDAPESNA